MEVYDELEKALKKIERQEEKIMRLNIKNLELTTIIKEAREYIEHENFKRTILVGVSTRKYTRDILNNVLEILDKEKE